MRVAEAFREEKSPGPGSVSGASKGAGTPGKGDAGAGTVVAPVGPGTMKYKPKKLPPDSERAGLGGNGCSGLLPACVCVPGRPGSACACSGDVAAVCTRVTLKPKAVDDQQFNAMYHE